MAEVTAIVDSYFAMLRLELLGKRYNKVKHRQRLVPKLRNRSKGSIEYKHQNISAVMVARGLPYIDGYKPQVNYQQLLANVTDRFLETNSDFFTPMVEGLRLNPNAAPPSTPERVAAKVFVDPPDLVLVPQRPPQPWRSRRGCKLDFVRRDAENRRLGKLGEEWVVTIEQQRLKAMGREDLAHKVEWVAETCGDGLGFDVLSFNEQTDEERWVEVKTTGLGKFFPFSVTDNEVRCSKDMPDKYALYRVFSFSTAPRIYMLHGAIKDNCALVPKLYGAYTTGNTIAESEGIGDAV